MGSTFSAELLELIDNRLEYQVMPDIVGGCGCGGGGGGVRFVRR